MIGPLLAGYAAAGGFVAAFVIYARRVWRRP
jgi:hypothetical protein